MTKFFSKLKKTLVLAHFGPFSQLWEQKKFSWKIWHAQLHKGFYHHAKI